MRRRIALLGLLVALLVPLVVGRFGLFLAATILTLGLYGAAFDLLYGYTGPLSFGHSVFYGVGAYAGALALADGFGPLVALALALLVAGVVAVPLGLVAIRVTSHGFVIVTIIFALIAHQIATSWTAVTGGSDGRTVIVSPLRLPGLGELSLVDPVVRYYVALAVLVATLLALHRLVRSPVGLAFRLVRDNERRARLLGYDVRRYKLAAFAISGGVAGLAGGLSTLVTGFVSAADFSLIVAGDPIIVTLLGGRGTLVGPVIGAALIRLAEFGISDVTAAYPLFVGAILVLTVVVEPEGVVGIADRVRGRLAEREEEP